MWFMDNAAITVVENAPRNGNSAGANTNPYGTPRQIKSVVGLENIYTENLESTALMFATGQPLIRVIDPSAAVIIDPLESLDLSS